jgi:hypothetical protein
MQEKQEATAILWDESVLEKAESLHAEGLCSVRSSKAKRLTRIKPGFFSPPTFKPVFVPGLHWISLLLVGPGEAPSVLAMRWWTSRGPLAQEKRALQIRLLEQCVKSFGPQALHIFDRGYAGSPWVEELCQRGARFLMRWPGRYKLIAGDDALWQPRSAAELVRGKRSVDHRLVWDARQHGESKRGIVFLPVWTPDTRHRLWLVVCRRGNGEPWYLVTSDPVTTVDQAWGAVFAYARRWQIEMCWRYSKSELAMESPRLWHWEEREKLLLMVTLVYTFLLSLLETGLQAMREWLLRHYCHRTGKRSRQRAAPLYRLRSALSRLWNSTGKPIYNTTQAQPQNTG